MTVVVAAAMLIMASCERKPVMAHAQFKHLPAVGWQRSKPLMFQPQYDDSTATYDVMLAVRHSNSYPYRNLSLVVDIVDTDSAVNRRRLNVALADEYGNWLGGGFGSLYQDKVTIATGLAPVQASAVKVWQVMSGCDTLHGVADVGVITVPK